MEIEGTARLVGSRAILPATNLANSSNCRFVKFTLDGKIVFISLSLSFFFKVNFRIELARILLFERNIYSILFVWFFLTFLVSQFIIILNLLTVSACKFLSRGRNRFNRAEAGNKELYISTIRDQFIIYRCSFKKDLLNEKLTG